LAACQNQISDKRRAKDLEDIRKLPAEKRSEIERLMRYDVLNDTYLPESVDIHSKHFGKVSCDDSLHIEKIPSANEYAELFNRSPAACISYPGVSEELLGKFQPAEDWLLRDRKRLALRKWLQREEVERAISLKERGVLPRNLNPV
jgi:hypothetical protein